MTSEWDAYASAINRLFDKKETITSDYYYTKENYPTYKDFASEFGYGEDSIKGLKIYKLCLVQGGKLHKLFTDKDIEDVRKELEL